MHKIIICNPNALIDLCLDSLSTVVCCHIYNSEFVYENINIFLPNDHIWNYRNLPNPLIYFIHIFKIFHTYCKEIED